MNQNTTNKSPRTAVRRAGRLAVIACLLPALLACPPAVKPSGGKKGDTPKEQPAATKQSPAAGQQAPGAKTPGKPMMPPKLAEPVYYAGAHILIGYKGSSRSKATRSKDEAKALATKLAVEARKAPDKFAELAKKNSEGPSAPAGGDLGTWVKGRMVPAFDKAIEGLKVGEVSEPVETPFGFHVIIRNPVLPAEELAARQLIIVYKGSMMATPTATRDKDAARKLAEQMLKKAKANPKGFVALIKKHSDGPKAKGGGSLGPWNSLKSRMPAVFTKTVRVLKVGELSGVVETPFGFHVMQRTEIPPMLAGSHILVAYKGAMKARPNITRSKKEAKKLATEIAAQLKKEPKKFVEMAAKNSDGPSATRGGRLGSWRKGKMVPEFDEAIIKLKVGEISPPVESPFGFHVMRRDAVEK